MSPLRYQTQAFRLCPLGLRLHHCYCCFFVFTEHSDVDQETALAGAQGFLGCLSAVQLSHVAPLKAALQPGHPALITISGHVTESSCVAQAGTDATSRERTHSFAGGPWVFLYWDTNAACLLDLKSSDVAVVWPSREGVWKSVLFNFQLALLAISFLASPFPVPVGHYSWHFLSLK